MANLSIREAVKHYQVSRPTLTKALKSGKVSGNQDEQGTWSIDPSELTRVYQPRSLIQDAPEHDLSGKFGQTFTTANTKENQSSTKTLEREIELLREMLDKAEANASHWREMAGRQQVLLEDKRQPVRPAGIWARLFNR